MKANPNLILPTTRDSLRAPPSNYALDAGLQACITEWLDEELGPKDHKDWPDVVQAARSQMQEFASIDISDGTFKQEIIIKAADVAIALYRLMDMFDINLHHEISGRMAGTHAPKVQ